MMPCNPSCIQATSVLWLHVLQVAELQEMWPDLTEAAALRALEVCNGK
jgi:hypothetical protein